MPLPVILGVAAAVAAAGGLGAGISGGIKMKEADDKSKEAQERHEKNVARFESVNTLATKKMDALGRTELEILKGFEEFSKLMEKIQDRPLFHTIERNGVKIPEYQEIKKVYVGANALIGGLGGAAAGTAGGFAAAGATTAAVMALGTASTGTAIASLSGAAATNAALAALGGGAIAAGGGGIALGTAVLGGATLGVGLLVGGVIFNFTGDKLSQQADEAWDQMLETEKEINQTVSYLNKLISAADSYLNILNKVRKVYLQNLEKLKVIVNQNHKMSCSWNQFTAREKMDIDNTMLLVGLLYEMCKVQLVLQSANKNELNQINYVEMKKMKDKVNDVLENIV